MSEFIGTDGRWDSELLFAQFPLDIAMKVLGYPLPRVMFIPDSYVWASTANGKFTTRSAYLNLLVDKGLDLSSDISWLWKLPIPARWVYFLWLAWRGRLVTRALRASWGLDTDASCGICGVGIEDVLHVLRDFQEAVMVCKQLILQPHWHQFFGSSLQDWLRDNLDNKEHDWQYVVKFATACWRLWTRRCGLLFQA